MAWTLESGTCPKGQTENSVHIETCRSCSATLPWAGSASTNLEEVRAVHIHEKKVLPTWVRVSLMLGGGFLVVLGIALFVFNLLTVRFGYGGAMILIMIGGAIYVKGEGLEVEERR